MRGEVEMAAALPMQSVGIIFAQADGMAIVAILCQIILVVGLYVLMALSFAKLFEKAGKPSWAGWVPIYHIVVLVEIAKKPGWWIAMLLIPCYQAPVFWILLGLEIAKVYGKTPGFGVGLGLLSPIFFPMLAFSDAKYQYSRGGPVRRPDYEE